MPLPLPFTAPWLLAPMEGVTDPVFRACVLALHRPDELGGAFTEFVRVTQGPVPRRVLERHLSGARHGIPVGLQLMGRELEALARSARRAAEAGAPIVDLNFGCPARGALRGCAGSALLADPRALEAVVAACVRGVEGRVAVSAKVRAGVEDAERVEEIARAAEAGGAALLTVHCRTRREGYAPRVDWSRIARAVAATGIPVCGNGGVRRHADLERMRRETGCDYVMVGHGALADPWIFGGRGVSRRAAARFLAGYAAAMQARTQAGARGAAARVKQLLRVWTAGGLLRSEDERAAWLREPSPEVLLARLERLAGPAPDSASPVLAGRELPPRAAGAPHRR